MDAPTLDNRTDFAAHSQLLLDVDGEKLVTVVKASLELPAGESALDIAPAARARGVRLADVPWGDPAKSSIAFPADLCLRKPGTDVVVVGKAHAPRAEPVRSFDVHVSVGPLAKSLAIHGLRVWEARGAALSIPAPVAEIELRWEYAWGGYDDSDPERIVEEPRNPIGRGKVRDPASLTDQPGPQIEDPAVPIGSRSTEPAPAGVGAIGRHWEPRRRHAGTYDESWLRSRAPLPPADFDDRFHLCAPAELHATSPLVGGETVKLWNLLPGGGATTFLLPRIDLRIEFRVRGRSPVAVAPHLDTVLLDLLATSEAKPPAVELTWRAHTKAPRRMSDALVVVREEVVR